jgi:hypothetical protein
METLPTPEEPSFVPPIRPVMNTAQPVVETPAALQPAYQPAPQYAPQAAAPVYAPVPPVPPRPASPGVAPAAVAPATRQKPGLSYYILLLLLIVLSVFTLWLYKQRAGDSNPNLSAPTASVEQPAQPTEYQPEPIVLPVAEPEPVPVEEPDNPFLVAEPTVSAAAASTAAEPVVNKPVYGVHGPAATKLVPVEEYYEDDQVYYDDVPADGSPTAGEELVAAGVLPDGIPYYEDGELSPEEFFREFDEQAFWADSPDGADETPIGEEYYEETYETPDGTEVHESYSHILYESGSVENM